MIASAALVLGLCFIQNISFSMTSRSRNRNNRLYHAGCAVFSNLIFFLTFRELVAADLNPWLIPPYVIGTVSGSLCGAEISMKIEKLIGAKA